MTSAAMRLPWDGPERLALERSDRPGLASFLTKHRACEGGIDVRPLPGEGGLMIRVTCTRCGRAIEAPATSWEGWWEEQAIAAHAPLRRFEPRAQPAPIQPIAAPRRSKPASAAGGPPRWRFALAAIVVIAWTAIGLLLIASALAH